MKAVYTLMIIAGLVLCLAACKKDGIANPGSIVGRWNILTDSTFAGVGINNHAINYQGQPGDYFDFTANGVIYTKEGNVLDTLSYRLVSNTSIIIGAFGITLNGTAATSSITNFTANSLAIQAPIVLTPGGEFGRKISLSR